LATFGNHLTLIASMSKKVTLTRLTLTCI
jgi:hypothetical protein